jgi:transcriptional regulator with XRE-family HTH domain
VALGDRVKALRDDRRLSRAKLAHDSGVSYAFVQQLETGVRKDPGVRNLGAVAAVLGVSVDSLLDETGEAVPQGGPAVPLLLPARAEIDELLNGLSADDLVSARDLLRAWTSRVSPQVAQHV